MQRLIVLLVDDDQDDIDLLHEAIKGIDGSIQLIAASDGLKALELLNSAKPNHVFLDVHMPVMTGIEVLERIRSTEQLRDLPVTVYSTNSPDYIQEKCKSLGADYIEKPATFDEIKTIVKQKLKGNETWNEIIPDQHRSQPLG